MKSLFRLSSLSLSCVPQQSCCAVREGWSHAKDNGRITTRICKLIYALEWVSGVHAGSSSAAAQQLHVYSLCARQSFALEANRARCANTRHGGHEGVRFRFCACMRNETPLFDEMISGASKTHSFEHHESISVSSYNDSFWKPHFS